MEVCVSGVYQSPEDATVKRDIDAEGVGGGASRIREKICKRESPVPLGRARRS